MEKPTREQIGIRRKNEEKQAPGETATRNKGTRPKHIYNSHYGNGVPAMSTS